ncbi:MAG: hypothetical protein LBD73_04080 [Deferribacteraceae bacterium]|nr:hypothetical protein [Deferribacteraceae bacterium]
MRRFEQIIVEFHNILSFYESFPRQLDILEKINETHQVIHVHGNNRGDADYIYKQGAQTIEYFTCIPRSIEISYVRKESKIEFIAEDALFPTELDSPNDPNLPDLHLGALGAGLPLNIFELIDTHQVISFELFDTLLVRPYINAAGLFLHLEMIYGLRGFAKQRISAERKARKKYKNRNKITYDQIYELLDKKYSGMKQKELEFEYTVSIANPFIMELFKYALSKQKSVIIVSDSYLPKDIIEKMLLKCGYGEYIKLFLLSELMETTPYSSMFGYILNDLNISPSGTLYIGNSDCAMAAKDGMAVFHHEKVLERFYRFFPRGRHFSKRATLGISIMFGVFAVFHNRSYWENIGYLYAGPAILQWRGKNTEEIFSDIFRSEAQHTMKGLDMIKFFITLSESSGHKGDNKDNGDIDNYEKIKIDIYPKISEGAENFADDILKIFGGIDTFIKSSDIVKWVGLFMDTPTEEDKRYFICIKHAADSGHTEYLPLLPPWYGVASAWKAAVRKETINLLRKIGFTLMKYPNGSYEISYKKLIIFYRYIDKRKKIIKFLSLKKN